jgi:hypothetical protein
MFRATLFSLALLVLAAQAAPAQDIDFREDLRLAEALRNRGDNDLALELLEKLAKNAPPELAKELPLEFAKTRLRFAADQPETAKRLQLYKEAQADFQKFIDANPGHPRLAEANLEVARVLNLLGKTQLSQALLNEEVKIKKELADKARATLVQAADKLYAAVKALEAVKEKLPSPDDVADPKKKKEAQAAVARVEHEIKQTNLERGLNLYDQSETYLGGNDEAASALLVKAKEVLDPLAGGAPAEPITWKARAWLGRIIFETESADKARGKFAEVIGNTSPVAAEGARLAKYFRMRVIRKQPSDVEKKAKGGPDAIIVDSARRWRRSYPRFLKTPEGCGVTFLLAEILLEEANKPKNPQAANLVAEARQLLRELEQTENEFTDRARRLKIQAIMKQGGFTRKVQTLRTFEDCYVRAQYEAFKLSQEEKKDRRKAHIDNLVAALKRALASPEVKKMKAGLELNNARAMLAYWALNTGDLEEAVKAGETFAREDPRSSQAAMSAVYALQAYVQMVGQKEKYTEEELARWRNNLFSLARYMEERWGAETPGEFARYTIGRQLLQEENFPEGIKKLALVTTAYPGYTEARYYLAETALKAHGDKDSELIPGDRPGDYRKRALLALESMPASALGSDPRINLFHYTGKLLLGRELYRDKRFAQMDQLADSLLGQVDKLTFSDNAEENAKRREGFKLGLVGLKLYARYGLADAALQAGDFSKAATLLDPLVNEAVKPEDTPEKVALQENRRFASAVLTTALKANLQLGKIERTEAVLEVLNKVTADGDAASTTNILRLLAFLIRGQVDDVRKKGDKEALDRAIKGYRHILAKQIAKQKGELKPDFIRVLADCYSSMGEHGRAADELAKVSRPKGKVGAEEAKTYKAIVLLQVRELRLSGTKAHLEKARKIMDEARGPELKPGQRPPQDLKPGWARGAIDAIMEHGQLLEAEQKWGEGFGLWRGLVQMLARKVQGGGRTKELYFECFYHMIRCHVKIAMGKARADERDKLLKQAAQQVLQFERSWEDFGNEASKKRFTELLAAEAGLKEQYDTLQKKK